MASSALLLISLALSGVLAEARQLESALGPVVDLGYAAFAGNTTSPTGIANGPVAFYGGIPYAQPPVGPLRWRAPQLLDESTDTDVVTDARSWGVPCIQYPATVGVGSEGNHNLQTPLQLKLNVITNADCLTLNLWKPTNASEGQNLPVAVYIHVGS